MRCSWVVITVNCVNVVLTIDKFVIIIESGFSQGIAVSRKVQELLLAAASSILDGEADDAVAPPKKKKRKTGK